jgi:hypothetical protein
MSIILFLLINTFNNLLMLFVYPYSHYLFKYIGNTIYVLQVFSQIYTTIINPGIPNRNNYISEEVMETLYHNMRLNDVMFDKYRICRQCNILVTIDENIIHCDECDICFRGI